MIDWDAYRAAYPQMTWADLVTFHRRVWEAFPHQDYHSHERLDAFFSPGARSVLEVGGWRGEAAAHVLAAHPEITRWDNFEVCDRAVEATVTADPRYHATAPDRWPWEVVLADRHETVVLAHVIEHVSADQLRRLLDWAAASGMRRAYVEAPLLDEGRSWRRQTSAHVLGIGWNGVRDLFAAHGLALSERFNVPDAVACVFEATT